MKRLGRIFRLCAIAAALVLCSCQTEPAREPSARALADIYCAPQARSAYAAFQRINFGEGKRFVRFSETFAEDGLAVIASDAGGSVRHAVYDMASETERFYLDASHKILRIRSGFAVAERAGKLGVYESRTGRRILDARYGNVEILTDRFLTADGVLYGVSASGAKELFNPDTSVSADLYESVTVDTVHNCAMARRKGGRDVLDREGKVLFPLAEGEILLGDSKKLTPAGETGAGEKRYRLYSALDGSEEDILFAGDIVSVTELNAANGGAYNRDLWGWYLVDAVAGGAPVRYLTDGRLNVRHTFQERVVARVAENRYLAERESGYVLTDGDYGVTAELTGLTLHSYGPEGIVAERGGRWGALTVEGAPLAPFEYDEILPFSGGTALARRGAEYFSVRQDGVHPADEQVLGAGDGWYAVSGGDGVTVLKNFNGTRLAGMTSAEVTAFSVAQKYAGKQFILSAQAVYKAEA